LLKIAVLLTATITMDVGEYAFTPPIEGKKTAEAYYDSIGVPDIKTQSSCPPLLLCNHKVVNHKGETIKSFTSEDSSLTISTKARYSSAAYAVVEHQYVIGRDLKGNKIFSTETFLLDDEGKNYPAYNYHFAKRNIKLASIFTEPVITIMPDGGIVEATSEGIVINGDLTLPGEIPFEHVEINNNLSGDIAVIAVGKNDFIWISDMKKWKVTPIRLSRRGDRKGVLSVYPLGNGNVALAVYKYVNSFNKGIVFAAGAISDEDISYGWLYNSKDRNVGFDPSVYAGEKNIYVTAWNSTEKKDVYFILPLDGDFKTLSEETPEHATGFASERIYEFLLGAGLSKLSWNADSQIRENGKTLYNADYDISDALYESQYFQGRIGKRQLAITYLQNEADKKGELVKKASRFLTVAFDIHDFFSPQSSLRLYYEESKVNGIATLNDNILNTITDVEFETAYRKFAALVMKERGFYWGVDWADYKMPTVLGFSDYTKTIQYVIFDENFHLRKLTLVGGYDILAYAKRYETDLERFYSSGKIGFGFAFPAMSGDWENRIEDYSEKTINLLVAGVLEGDLELGYIYQRAFLKYSGLGYALTAGYKARASFIFSGQSTTDEETISETSLEMELGRFDLWHGPYVTVNIIF